ncbi:MAG: DUF362 domain-containing protein, partial [Spirochaetaceae bacterium]|nr:DUF362 domain-containing protein [Spirochaetaceae bacterium]
PKAQVMKEVFIPRTFSEVVRGEAFYISLPKMKTNLYTGVTLGFKNAMGCLSTNMRYRNHNYNIDKKLVDLLYLFQPDLTIIDGIVGAEGDVPAPVDPVDSRLIISGTNSVETDRVATRIMSHDPSKIRLMQVADAQGFNDPEVEVFGEVAPIPWRPADTSVISGNIAKFFPRTRFLVGATKNGAPKLGSLEDVTIETLKAMERACPGGCLPTIIMAFEGLRYTPGYDPERYDITVLLGAGAEFNGDSYYFDKDCKAYSRDDIKRLPGKVVASGACCFWMKGYTEYCVEGCTAHVSKLSGAIGAAVGVKNPFLATIMRKPSYLASILGTMLRRIKVARVGNPMDVELCMEDRIFEGRELTADEKERDWVACEIPPLTKAQIKKQIQYILNPIPS